MSITRAAFLILTICVTWIGIADQVSGQARRPPPPPRAPPPPPPLPTLATLDLEDPTTYPTFITNMRNTLAEKNTQGNNELKCTMRKLSGTIPRQRYAYVNLIASPSHTVTLAMDVTDTYVIGYIDKFNGQDRAFFFKDTYDEATYVFPGVTGVNRIRLTYTGSYGELEKYAGDREDNPLGIFNIQNSIITIYGKDSNPGIIRKNQAKFFLLAIQMVAEATRFKYISQRIPENAYEALEVDLRITTLENGWDPLSSAVHQSSISTTTPTSCALLRPVSLALTQGQLWTFNTVEDIKQLVGLLKAQSTTTSLFTINNNNNNNNDNDDIFAAL